MKMLQKLLACSAAAAACMMLSGCQTASRMWDAAAEWTPSVLHPYRPDVHQGNLITSEMTDQLEKGMSQDQVQFLLGIPLLQDRLHADRWDYIYYLNRRNGETQVRRLTVYFGKDGRVERWESDAMPDETTADLMILNDKDALAKRAKEKAAASEAAAAAAEKKE